MTDSQKPPPSKTAIGALALAAGAAVAAIVMPFVSGWESGGKVHTTAYQDIVGVWTVCDGDTQGVTSHTVETAAGCKVRLDQRLAQFATPVLQCTPNLQGHPYQLSAAISLAYNIGVKSYCHSTADRQFRAGHWRAACDAFLLWNRAGGKVVQGLVNRRTSERNLCLKELPA